MNIKITKELIVYLGRLANIKLTDEQITCLQQDLTRVTNYMDEIKNLDLSKIPSTYFISDETNVFRDDVVKKSLPKTEVLKNAASKNEDFFVVSSVLKHKK